MQTLTSHAALSLATDTVVSPMLSRAGRIHLSSADDIGGRWITIGASHGSNEHGEEEEAHGGAHVFIRDGKIEKGPKSLTGKTIGQLKSHAGKSKIGGKGTPMDRTREKLRKLNEGGAKHSKPTDNHGKAIEKSHAAWERMTPDEQRAKLKAIRDKEADYNRQHAQPMSHEQLESLSKPESKGKTPEAKAVAEKLNATIGHPAGPEVEKTVNAQREAQRAAGEAEGRAKAKTQAGPYSNMTDEQLQGLYHSRNASYTTKPTHSGHEELRNIDKEIQTRKAAKGDKQAQAILRSSYGDQPRSMPAAQSHAGKQLTTGQIAGVAIQHATNEMRERAKSASSAASRTPEFHARVRELRGQGLDTARAVARARGEIESKNPSLKAEPVAPKAVRPAMKGESANVVKQTTASEHTEPTAQGAQEPATDFHERVKQLRGQGRSMTGAVVQARSESVDRAMKAAKSSEREGMFADTSKKPHEMLPAEYGEHAQKMVAEWGADATTDSHKHTLQAWKDVAANPEAAHKKLIQEKMKVITPGVKPSEVIPAHVLAHHGIADVAKPVPQAITNPAAEGDFAHVDPRTGRLTAEGRRVTALNDAAISKAKGEPQSGPEYMQHIGKLRAERNANLKRSWAGKSRASGKIVSSGSQPTPADVGAKLRSRAAQLIAAGHKTGDAIKQARKEIVGFSRAYKLAV